MRRTLVVALAFALAAAAAPAAFAATPESGYVGADRLQQKWSGEAYGQPFKIRDLQERCDAPFCDSFVLDVRAKGNLTLTLNAPGSAYYVDVEVMLPDGTIDFYEGNDTDRHQTIVYADAALGQYRIRIWPNRLPVFYDPAYDGTAKLVLPPPPPPTPAE